MWSESCTSVVTVAIQCGAVWSHGTDGPVTLTLAGSFAQVTQGDSSLLLPSSTTEKGFAE